MAARQGLFKKYNEFVAVRPIRLSTTQSIEPGTEIDKSKYRTFQLKKWFKRRRIGTAGSEWVSGMLADKENSRARPEITGVLKPVIPENMSETINLLGVGIPREDFIHMAIDHFDALDVRKWNLLDADKRVDALHLFFDKEVRRLSREKLASITKNDKGFYIIPEVDEVFRTKRGAEAYILGVSDNEFGEVSETGEVNKNNEVA